MYLSLENEDSPLSRSLGEELQRIEQYVQMVLTYQRLDSVDTDYVFRECSLDLHADDPLLLRLRPGSF